MEYGIGIGIGLLIGLVIGFLVASSLATKPFGNAAGLALGKRLSSNFYALYESGLGGALGTLFLFYDLSQKLTVRAQTGAQTAHDLIYTLSFD